MRSPGRKMSSVVRLRRPAIVPTSEDACSIMAPSNYLSVGLRGGGP